MGDATAEFLAGLRRIHAEHDHETDPERLAAALGIRVIVGRQNAARGGGAGRVITFTRDSYAPRQRFTMHHEMAHVLMQDMDLEGAIEAEVSEDSAEPHREAVANFGAALLLMPDPLVEAALRAWGDKPQAIFEVAQGSGASFAAALRRYVGHDLTASRAAFVTAGSYVLDAASVNMYPIRRYSRLPDPHAAFPNAALLSVPGRDRVVGVLVD